MIIGLLYFFLEKCRVRKSTMFSMAHTQDHSLQHLNFYNNYFCLYESKRLPVQMGSFSHTIYKDEREKGISI